MIGCPSRRQLDQFLDEQLDSATRNAVEAHVGQCPSCQKILETAAAAGIGSHLRNLHVGRSSALAEPRGELLRRIEQAGLAGKPREIVIEATRDFVAPAGAPPFAGSLSNQPTRHAPSDADESTALGDLPPGSMLGQYRILSQLGAGGMGQVYKAVHVAMDRIVALKVIAPHLLKDARARARFQQEVRTAAKLHHPHIVMAHDAAEANGLSFLVMEYVEGTTLSTLVSEQGLPPVPVACEIIRQAAWGLQHAHDKAMVHRDIKPGNLMVAAQQTAGSGAIVPTPKPGDSLPGWPTAPLVKILDFGVARLREVGPDGEPLKMKTLTQEGCVVGTPEFMSPEQACDSRMVDIRSDIYSLGCTFYFLLTGRPPFSATTALETMVQHLKSPLPAVDKLRPGLAPGLVAIVEKMLAKSANERYQMPAELAEALESWTGAHASAVAEARPIPVERGLAPTAPASMEAVHPTKDSPSVPAPHQQPAHFAEPPILERPSSNQATLTGFLAILLVVLASTFAFLYFLNRNQESTTSDKDGDSATIPPQVPLMPIPAGDFQRWFSTQKLKLGPFKIGATEVTRAQYKKFTEAAEYQTFAEQGHGPERGSLVPGVDGKRTWDATITWQNCGIEEETAPVTCVAWEDALQFCNWLSQQEKLRACYRKDGNIWECDFKANGYRLPTDAEWEYAARLDQDLSTSSGLEDAALFGWFRAESDNKPHSVGKKPASPAGLFDVWGNVWEWCWDLHKTARSGEEADPADFDRVIWGGGWNDTPAEVAKSPRRGLPPDHRAMDVGFRVVRTGR
jgi:serine/threonine-protein kinase